MERSLGRVQDRRQLGLDCCETIDAAQRFQREFPSRPGAVVAGEGRRNIRTIAYPEDVEWSGGERHFSHVIDVLSSVSMEARQTVWAVGVSMDKWR